MLPEIDMAYSFFTQLYGLNHLVTNLGREMLFFGDETRSRHHFEEKKALFWRRDRISSPFWGRKRSILTTKGILVANLGREMLFFGDEANLVANFDRVYNDKVSWY
ncbi:hypothetical protein M4A92_14565 [Caldibacillus thermoamylovorans]|uniref:hypothetical protein n=1 Tax=Caldibacillus thermoamylovorans TaxID=35841 RepID=UPI00203D5F92|nr:hypothetical protein [Caldibacillus thermoamylovorans]MCM3799822.1 hypothetical protein [Caldibacillus thermoamylovorans]